MPIDVFSKYGLLFERTSATRKAITRVRRYMGRDLRQRTQRDDHLLYMSVAMSYEGLQSFTQIARASGCEPGLHFVELVEARVIGTHPEWLCIESALASPDPWLGLRPETWESMEPDVRELYEELRQQKKSVLLHVKDQRVSERTDA